MRGGPCCLQARGTALHTPPVLIRDLFPKFLYRASDDLWWEAAARLPSRCAPSSTVLSPRSFLSLYGHLWGEKEHSPAGQLLGLVLVVSAHGAA